jgi:LPXTG-motif cell wall-anchored protein
MGLPGPWLIPIGAAIGGAIIGAFAMNKADKGMAEASSVDIYTDDDPKTGTSITTYLIIGIVIVAIFLIYWFFIRK